MEGKSEPKPTPWPGSRVIKGTGERTLASPASCSRSSTSPALHHQPLSSSRMHRQPQDLHFTCALMLKLQGLEMLHSKAAFYCSRDSFSPAAPNAATPEASAPLHHAHKGDMIQTRLYLRLGDQHEHRHWHMPYVHKQKHSALDSSDL